MNLITLDKISKSYSEKILLDNVTLNINEGDKIGLIGFKWSREVYAFKDSGRKR